MAEPDQSVIIRVPFLWGARARQVFAEEVIDFIQTRTDKGLDVNNRPFKGYSGNYVKTQDFQLAGKSKNDVNLQFTSDMLFSLELKSHGRGFVRIGASDSAANDKIAWNKRKGRTFLGVSDQDRLTLIRRVEGALGL